MNPIVEYWYFHLPNYVLALIQYTLMGRFVLGLFVDAESGNYIWRFFVRLTDPVLRAVQMVTPLGATEGVLMVFAILWMLVLRIALFVLLAGLDLAPKVS